MRQIRIYDNNKTIGKCKEAIVEDIFMNSIDEFTIDLFDLIIYF